MSNEDFPELIRHDGADNQKQIKEYLPVGTLEDLRTHGLDPAEFGACCKKDPGNGILGCPAFHMCNLPKTGVKRFGVRIIKSAAKGGVMRNEALECYTAVVIANQASVDRSGDLVQIIAKEGEEIDVIESRPVKDAMGITRSYEDFTTKRKVTPFPKIGENRELLRAAFAGAERKKDEERRAAMQVEDALAVAGVPGGLLTGQQDPGPQKPKRS